jgi:hypothetical protein
LCHRFSKIICLLFKINLKHLTIPVGIKFIQAELRGAFGGNYGTLGGKGGYIAGRIAVQPGQQLCIVVDIYKHVME